MLTPMYGIPESISCYDCDCDSPDTLEDAIAAGWTDLMYDDGISWTYLGQCPECKRLRESEEIQHDLDCLKKSRHLLEVGWRPVAVHDPYDLFMWVDPVGGRAAKWSDAVTIQELRESKHPQREERIESIYDRIKNQKGVQN